MITELVYSKKMSHQKCASSTEEPKRLTFDNDDNNETNDDQNHVQVNLDVESGQQILGGLDDNKDSCEDHIDSQEHIYGEIQISGESDLQTYFNNCKKNPGHEKFIPVNDFNLSYLPEGYRDLTVYRIIKCTADLTVRVAVEKTSLYRPAFLPDTQIPYPCYIMRDKTVLRTGSGVFCSTFVEKFTDGINDRGDKRECYTRCWCKKCQHSATASNVWWEFDVLTSEYLVFDDVEAKYTSLRFFYDTEDSPEFIVDKVYVEKKGNSLCLLKCVTCNEKLEDKLVRRLLNFSKACEIVNYLYRESREVDKLSILVSHPHGRAKRISIGQWMEKYESEKCTKLTYSTSSCPGCCGAPVHCFGFEKDLSNQFVNSGSFAILNNLTCIYF